MIDPRATQRKRGVYVDRIVGELLEITVVMSDGTSPVRLQVHEAMYDTRWPGRWRQWLDRHDPQLKLASL
jgi:hypothetical protein